MSEFAWFDFQVSGGEKALDQFHREFNKGELSKLISYSDEHPVELTVNFVNPRVLKISMGGEDICSGTEFDQHMRRFLWDLADAWGLTVTGGVYNEDDWGHWRGSFNADGNMEYASIDWVRNELTAQEVRQLKEYAEETFGRMLL